MSSRTQSHKLSGGLYVSGRRDSHPTTPRTPTMSSISKPYTGGDLSKSGELAKMFDLSLSSTSSSSPKLPSRTPSSSQPNSGSGPQPRLSNSGRVSTSNSGLHPTGLITSGPLTSSAAPPPRRSGHLDPHPQQPQPQPGKMVYGAAVTNMCKDKGGTYGVRLSKGIMWALGILIIMGLLVGVFLMVAVKKPVILLAVAALLVPMMAALAWNYAWAKRAVFSFVTAFPDTELRGALDGQFVKVTGVVTCGSIPLESSYQREPRCVYVSTELYEYKGWGGKSANPKHHCFSWGTRHSEKYVADFYVSDFHTGLRALVKSGNGAKVTPLVESATVANITKEKRDLSPNFLQWLADRSLSSDDRVMRLKEGYVKEGSTVSVMGVVRRHENIVMIVPPEDPVSTGCQWLRCLLPMYIEGLILHCEDNQNSEVIPV